MIPVKYKSGVSLVGVQPQVVLGIMMAARAYADMGREEMWVTSVTDGVHSEGSLHYEGLAFDLRVWGFDEGEKEQLAKKLRGILEGEWDVVLEGTHLHVEFDPD